ncbi:putative leader peptide [Streptomyces brasiliensis]
MGRPRTGTARTGRMPSSPLLTSRRHIDLQRVSSAIDPQR